jgi:hypothetical protein
MTFWDVELWVRGDEWAFVCSYLRAIDARRLVRRMPADVPLRVVCRSGGFMPKKLVVYERRRRDWGNWHEPRTYVLGDENAALRGLPSDECHCDRPLPARKREP